jgi:AcrR family transcriptional regulator
MGEALAERQAAVVDAALAVASGGRREGDAVRPLGRKAARTRTNLLLAAYAVFAERGYQGSTVAAITERAGVGAGTFYQYFRDRSDVLAALVAEAVRDALDDVRAWDATEGRDGLRAVVAGFVERYAITAPFQAVWEEITHVEPALAELRQALTELYVGLFETELRRAAALGLVRAELDAAGSARALTAMVDRYCEQVFVRGAGTEAHDARGPDVARITDLLVDLWAGAIGLRG